MAEQFTAHGSMRQAEVKFQSSGDDDRRKALGLATGRVIVLEYRNDPSKNHPSAATFQKSRVARNALLHCRKSKPFDFATATAITAPNLALKGRFLGGYSLEAERVRCPRAEGYEPPVPALHVEIADDFSASHRRFVAHFVSAIR
jgi:hypothetical protein